MNLVSFAFVDTTIFSATLALKYAKHFADNEQPSLGLPFDDCRHIVLRGPSDGDWNGDASQVDYPLLAQWPFARNLLADIEAQVKPFLAADNLQFGQVVIRSLRPGGSVAWHADQSPSAKAHARFALIVGPCAGGSWYCGGEQLAPGPGNLTFINHQALHSMINLGPVPQISVIADVRRPRLQ